jgi:membrane fusion protein, multidrug efflux system
MIYQFLAIWALSILLLSCTRGADEQTDGRTQTISASSSLEVKTVTAKALPFEYAISTTGKIRPRSDVQIHFKLAGIVASLAVKNGDQVAAGTILAQLDNRDQLFALRKAEVLLRERQIVYDDQIMSYSSSPDTLKFKNALENIRYTSGLAAAELLYQEAKFKLENTFIKATTRGIVSDLTVGAGNSVKADQIFCSIYDPGELLVDCLVVETDAIKLGEQTMGEVKSSEGVIAPAVIVEINPRVDAKTNMVAVVLKLATGYRFLPGMSTYVLFKVPFEKSIVVPKAAVLVRSGKHVVFTEENGLAKWNYVKVGRDNGHEIEILDGLKEDQSVIISNNIQLAHDTPIRASKGS